MASTVDNAVGGSEFPTNWDIDSYFKEDELEEHWLLRRRFMEAHKGKFPEDRLVCLAQVFTNVELLGCKYPDETMRLIEELTEDLAKDFREQRAKKEQRFSVMASDAAEERIKGLREAQQQQAQQFNNGASTSNGFVPNMPKKSETEGWQQPQQQMYQQAQQWQHQQQVQLAGYQQQLQIASYQQQLQQAGYQHLFQEAEYQQQFQLAGYQQQWQRLQQQQQSRRQELQLQQLQQEWHARDIYRQYQQNGGGQYQFGYPHYWRHM